MLEYLYVVTPEPLIRREGLLSQSPRVQFGPF